MYSYLAEVHEGAQVREAGLHAGGHGQAGQVHA